MNGPSDFFLQHGYAHDCVCGRKWYDSDGSPCHARCEACNEVVPYEEIDEYQRCEACAFVLCQGCKDMLEKEDLTDGLCPDCYLETKMVRDAEFHDLPKLLDLSCNSAQELLRKRLAREPLPQA